MKTIFLCENSDKLFSVYDEKMCQRLSEITDIEKIQYTKKCVLENPSKFKDVEIIFSTWGMPSFSEDEITLCFPSLKCIFYAAGTVQMFAREFLNCGVKVFSAWAANAVPVAEYTVAQIILANKDFFAQSRLLSQKRRDDANERLKSHIGNFGKKVGLIGCGMIGSLVANMLKNYDLQVLAYDPFLSDEKAKEINVKKSSLDEIFSSCYVVSNHLANNEQTKGMLDYNLFSKMLPFATFINTGRGAQVVEDDLVKVLCEREDLTAILDVTYPEPPDISHPFYTLQNCFLTPHIAGSLGGEVVRMAQYMLDEYIHLKNGEDTKYEVTLKMLETMA